MARKFAKVIACAAALATNAACTVQQTTVPALSGPSELALSIVISATPDSISQDGVSQSAVVVLARDAHAKPISALPIRLDMEVNGVLQDFGSLTTRNVVTGPDGRATSTYVAPPAPPVGAGGSGTVMTIRATPAGSNFQTATSQSADIRLVPPGVILPPAQTPLADFTFVPTTPSANAPVQFDASRSCAGALDAAGACPASAGIIVGYTWDFGDGGSSSGRTASHSFSLQQTYTVTLTVTNDRGIRASTPKTVSVGAGVGPKASFVFSPTEPAPDQLVVFNADASRAGPGHTIVQYSWMFGDGDGAEGFVVSHTFKLLAGKTQDTYNVTLTVLDEAGQKDTVIQPVTVKVP